jgi:hypothetical protein
VVVVKTKKTIVSFTAAFFAVWVLSVVILSVVVVYPNQMKVSGVSSAQEVISELEIEGTPETESVSDMDAEKEIELNLIVNPNVAFTVLPQEVATTIGDVFVIEVGVANVTVMYSWQVCLSFDNTILECINVSLPYDYVFSYAYTVSDALMDYNSTEFKNPLLYRIKNNEGEVLIGACLLGRNQTNFNGSGGLCQIEFKAISPGSSSLTLSIEQTYYHTLYRGIILSIIPTVSNSEVIVQET